MTATQVKDHASTTRLLKETLSKPAGDEITTNDASLLVNDHASVCVAIKADAEVAPFRFHCISSLLQIRLYQWIGLVHECTSVVLKVDLHDVKSRHIHKKLGHHRAGHAIRRVDCDLEPLRSILQTSTEHLKHMRSVRLPEIYLSVASTNVAIGIECVGHCFDFNESSLRPYWLAMQLADLEAVVIRWIVTCRGLHATDTAEVIDAKWDEWRIHQSDIDDVRTLYPHAVLQGLGQGWTGQTHIATNHNAAAIRFRYGIKTILNEQVPRHRAANAKGHLLVQRIRHCGPHVIRFENRFRHATHDIA